MVVHGLDLVLGFECVILSKIYVHQHSPSLQAPMQKFSLLGLSIGNEIVTYEVLHSRNEKMKELREGSGHEDLFDAFLWLTIRSSPHHFILELLPLNGSSTIVHPFLRVDFEDFSTTSIARSKKASTILRW